MMRSSVLHFISFAIIYDSCKCSFIPYGNCLNLVKDCNAKPNTDIDNTFAFITCQHKLNDGGCVIVPNGKYQVMDINLNTSNIIFYIEPSVTFIPYHGITKSVPIFQLGSTTSFTKNVSIIGTSSQKFVIDLTNNTISPWNVRGIQLLGIDGFLLSNINIKIKANLSDEKSAIEFDHNNVNGKIYHAKNGKVINITSSDFIWGYGTVQMQSGENIYFENLDGTGGVTLRLETGAGDQDGYVGNITGRNIICRNGQAGFMSEPHTQKNGNFDVSNITTYGCYIGVETNGGYTQQNKPPGYFTNGTINGVISYYGTNAQCYNNVTVPSCGPCGNENSVLNYPVKISGLQSINFPPPSQRNGCPHWDRYPMPTICPWDNSSMLLFQ